MQRVLTGLLAISGFSGASGMFLGELFNLSSGKCSVNLSDAFPQKNLANPFNILRRGSLLRKVIENRE